MTKLKRLFTYENIGKTLIFLSILSFFCGDLDVHVGFTLKPFHVVALISFVYLVATRKHSGRKNGFSKVDKAFLLFFAVSILTAITSPFSVANSFKHLVGVALLAGSFYAFKNLYLRFKANELSTIVSAAGLVIIAVTFIWYLIGLITLDFNFNIEDVWCYGVRVDRGIPRLISFAYDEPNFVSIYFSVLFAYFLSAKRNIKNIIGLAGSLAIIILTLSRGGYIAFAAMMLAYYLFAKISMKEKLIDTAILTVAAAISFTCATVILNTNQTAITASQTASSATMAPQPNEGGSLNDNTPMSDPNQAADPSTIIPQSNEGGLTGNNVPTDAMSLMATRFSTSISDSGSGRTTQWKNAITSFKNHPVTGIGPGNILAYNREAYNRGNPSHNSFLDVLAEQGTIGFASYLLLILIVVISCWKIRRFTIMPAMGFIFLFASELFLSLAITDMLFINILLLDVCEIYWIRKTNSSITATNKPKKKAQTSNPIKISFIVPVYNVGAYIERCLTSLVNQRTIEYEIIIVDDGSTDNSSEICKNFANKYKQIGYYRTTNNGLSAARNFGIKKARGEYIWFVDGDDFISDDALEALGDKLSHDIVCVGYYNYYDDEAITDGTDCGLKDNIARFLINPALAPTKIIRRDIIMSNNVKFEVGRKYEDVGLMYGFSKYTDDIIHADNRVYFYRRRANSISSSFSAKNFEDHLWATEQLCDSIDDRYFQEKEYQATMQLLFALFDINKRNCRSVDDYFDQANAILLKRFPDCVHNKYLSRKTIKAAFFHLYTMLLTRKKYKSLRVLNNIRGMLT